MVHVRAFGESREGGRPRTCRSCSSPSGSPFLHAPLLFLQLPRAVLQLANINLARIILRSRLAEETPCARSSTQSCSSKNWGAGTCFTLCEFVQERLEFPAYLVNPCRGIGERFAPQGDVRLDLLCVVETGNYQRWEVHGGLKLHRPRIGNDMEHARRTCQ